MVPVKVGEEFDYEAVNIDSDWNDSNDSELIMHTIHSYPAKFPAFIAWKAFEYAQNEGVKIKNVSDIFCGLYGVYGWNNTGWTRWRGDLHS